MKRLFQLLFVLLVIGLAGSCKSKQSISTITLSPNQQLVFLDSMAATRAIVKDDKEAFFEQIGVLDMSIQMKKNYTVDVPRDQVLEEYRHYLKKDVLSFSQEDKLFLENIFKRALRTCNKISSDLLGRETILIKTHAQHYGPSVYYTRENIIVIPKDVLIRKDEDEVYATILHELFHIYSRYHPRERAALYELIGFKNAGPVTNLQMEPALQQRILLNPDGVDFNYAIRLNTGEKKTILAIPLIFANASRFDPARPRFFSYIDFALFEISPPYSRMIKVHSTAEGLSKLTPGQLTDFYRQIKDNTQYILHPDEILADNFMFLAMSKEDAAFLGKFSDEGQQLISDIEKILTK